MQFEFISAYTFAMSRKASTTGSRIPRAWKMTREEVFTSASCAAFALGRARRKRVEPEWLCVSWPVKEVDEFGGAVHSFPREGTESHHERSAPSVTEGQFVTFSIPLVLIRDADLERRDDEAFVVLWHQCPDGWGTWLGPWVAVETAATLVARLKEKLGLPRPMSAPVQVNAQELEAAPHAYHGQMIAIEGVLCRAEFDMPSKFVAGSILTMPTQSLSEAPPLRLFVQGLWIATSDSEPARGGLLAAPAFSLHASHVEILPRATKYPPEHPTIAGLPLPTTFVELLRAGEWNSAMIDLSRLMGATGWEKPLTHFHSAAEIESRAFEMRAATEVERARLGFEPARDSNSGFFCRRSNRAEHC